MTEENFKTLEDLKKQISSIKDKIRKIDRLLNSCGLQLVVSGLHSSSYNRDEFILGVAKETIKDLLVNKKEELTKELYSKEDEFRQL
jgi:hypothetical protein